MLDELQIFGQLFIRVAHDVVNELEMQYALAAAKALKHGETFARRVGSVLREVALRVEALQFFVSVHTLPFSNISAPLFLRSPHVGVQLSLLPLPSFGIFSNSSRYVDLLEDALRTL